MKEVMPRRRPSPSKKPRAQFRIGYQLSSEEHRPNDLVKYAQMAEQHGFSFANISDHFHPWTDTQGQSPFVWAVIGGIAHATERLELGTWVTCPTMRMHPAIVAHAAATAAAMMEGRFFLGVGTGENLNEHILGDRWPEWDADGRRPLSRQPLPAHAAGGAASPARCRRWSQERGDGRASGGWVHRHESRG